jgi:hypothetical protein
MDGGPYADQIERKEYKSIFASSFKPGSHEQRKRKRKEWKLFHLACVCVCVCVARVNQALSLDIWTRINKVKDSDTKVIKS